MKPQWSCTEKHKVFSEWKHRRQETLPCPTHTYEQTAKSISQPLLIKKKKKQKKHSYRDICMPWKT